MCDSSTTPTPDELAREYWASRDEETRAAAIRDPSRLNSHRGGLNDFRRARGLNALGPAAHALLDGIAHAASGLDRDEWEKRRRNLLVDVPGDTKPVKAALKKYGCRWTGASWEVEYNRLDGARAIVAAGPSPQAKAGAARVAKRRAEEARVRAEEKSADDARRAVERATREQELRSGFAARHGGWCRACRQGWDAGAQIRQATSGAGYVHVTCPPRPAAPPQTVSAVPAVTTLPPARIRLNARDGHCYECGVPPPAGTGRLYFDMGCGEVDFDDERGVWRVLCLDADREACAARIEEQKLAARKEAEERRQVAIRRAALEKRFEGALCPPGPVEAQGEVVRFANSDGRIYGGGEWFVVEPAERSAPDPAALESARTETDRRLAALKAAQAELVAWIAAELPATAPYRLLNGGRAPDSLSARDRAALAPEQDARYAALEAEIRRLSYTSSPDSYHGPAARLRALELAQALASHERWVWIVRGNGADGDCWAYNNLPGAIGRVLPWTAELEAEVRACVEGAGTARQRLEAVKGSAVVSSAEARQALAAIVTRLGSDDPIADAEASTLLDALDGARLVDPMPGDAT